MNMKIALLGILAFTGNVASADEVRAIRPSVRGDRPAGSVLPGVDLKKKLPEGNAGEKSDLEEHRIVPTSNVDLLESKDGSSDEDSASEIDLAGPEDSDLCLDMRNRCKKKNQRGCGAVYRICSQEAASRKFTEDSDLCLGMRKRCKKKNRRDCNSVYDICSQEVASRKFNDQKFNDHFTGVCLDSKGRAGYPYLVFKNLSPDQCKAKCNDIPDVRVRGVEVGRVHSYDRLTCVCLMDNKDFSGCREFREFQPSWGYTSCNPGARRATSGTGPVSGGDSNPKWTCFPFYDHFPPNQAE